MPERGAEGVERVRELTGGDGTHTVLECVGLAESVRTALGVVRAGGTVSRVGVPQYSEAPIEQLLPDILVGRVEPGRVFDRTIGLDDVAAGYRAMAGRETLKVLIRP